ncbi:protein EXPORTIN 1A-like [Humulus lupulus]|uniref:protein EXPORTIN 1A-like n=1 Tax=Humulus lupulus TaxID=3486 RepID=UPI002B4032BD|nr:protein EXPORTIN 1A-like [Humulus lupulus]
MVSENIYLVMVIRDLLNLCEITKGKDNKAVIASNIMYVVGQYPRFLRAHSKFLKTVVNKLFEFMHETHPGVQDMACDTFLKIVQKCKRKFVIVQVGENEPFISELLTGLPTTVADLEPHQIHSFYESIGLFKSDPQKRDEFLQRLMELPNQKWAEIIGQARLSVDFVKDQDVIRTWPFNFVAFLLLSICMHLDSDLVILSLKAIGKLKQPSGKLVLNPGPSAERIERPSLASTKLGKILNSYAILAMKM